MSKDIIGIYGLYYNDELVYLGKSIHINERFEQHKIALRKDRHHCHSFQKWFNEENIIIDEIQMKVLESLKDDEYNNYYLYELELKHFNIKNPRFWGIAPNMGGYDPKLMNPELLKEIQFKKNETYEKNYKINFKKYSSKIEILYSIENKSIEDISKELNLTYNFVRQVLKEIGVAKNPVSVTAKEIWKNMNDDETIAFITKIINTYPTWPERAEVAGVSISNIRGRALQYELFTPKTVKTYKDVIEEFGEDFLKPFIKDNYLNGLKNTEYMTKELNCSLKSFFTLIEKLELRTSKEESVERTNTKNSNHEYELECSQCHLPFIAGTVHAKYCSPECVYNSKLIEHICKKCNEKYSNTSKNSEYCSRKCSYEANAITKECAKCHEDFQALRHNSKYCSKKCGKQ